MKRASYREGVQWIALNDEPTASEEELLSMISVLFLADLFDTTPARVVRDVLQARSAKT